MLLMFSEGQKTIDNGARDLKLFELDNGPLIHVEVNMEELPIFLFKSRDRVEESLQARNTIVTEDGRRLNQYVKVTSGREFGLPGPADRDAYVAVMRHVHRNGGMPADGWVSFSIYGLLRMMDKNPGRARTTTTCATASTGSPIASSMPRTLSTTTRIRTSSRTVSTPGACTSRARSARRVLVASATRSSSTRSSCAPTMPTTSKAWIPTSTSACTTRWPRRSTAS